ncbi:hypothetical protein [Streptomyces sp. NPDC006446]|uniref:hypothetical protein n=1 Tax=Streptomyces sp. NPDC006446 TaxID=3154301 RepID=UPI00339E8204
MNARGSALDHAELYEAIWRRHSRRFPFTDEVVPVSVLNHLGEAAQFEGARLTTAAPPEAERLLRITAEAERRNHSDPHRSAESRRWTSRDEADDTGVPSAVIGPQDAFERLPVRDFAAQRPIERLPARPFERTPTLASLTTGHDRLAVLGCLLASLARVARLAHLTTAKSGAR